MQEENALLKEIMTRNGIPVPDRTSALRSVATVSVLGKSDGDYSLQVTMPEMMDYSHPAFDNVTPPSLSMSSPESGENAEAQVEHYGIRDPDRSPQRRQQSTSNPSHLHNPQIGIDFVLSLEKPCLSHTQGSLSRDVPSGHALTAQAPLLTAAPPILSPATTWQVPAVEIDRLLELSSQLNLVSFS